MVGAQLLSYSFSLILPDYGAFKGRASTRSALVKVSVLKSTCDLKNHPFHARPDTPRKARRTLCPPQGFAKRVLRKILKAICHKVSQRLLYLLIPLPVPVAEGGEGNVLQDLRGVSGRAWSG